MTTHTETQEKTPHAKTPWAFEERMTECALEVTVADHSEAFTCAVCYGPLRLANAQYIVRACNSFPALLAALEGVMTQTANLGDHVRNTVPLDAAFHHAIESARAAIAAAKAP